VDHLGERTTMNKDRHPFVPTHRFAVGHTVRVSRSLFLPNIAVGDYTIIAHLPERDGELQYRVKSKLERYERVVKEDELAD
jgi:hypothetical protein